MSTKGKCIYNREWPRNPAYESWLQACQNDKHKAFCKACDRVIDVSTMGEAAIKSHAKADRHVRNVKSGVQSSHSIMSFFGAKSKRPTPSTSSTDDHQPADSAPSLPRPSTQPPMSTFISRNDLLKSEILWTLHTVTCHLSYKSNENISNLFRIMFPDSQMATKFSCGERKTAYLCVFGIAECFKQILISEVKGLPYSILFDESLNSKMQQKQMDILVRYWTNENKVISRYVGSQFLGHGTADDMLQHFQKGVLDCGLDISNMIQVSMDGPNVNWKFFDILKTKLFEEHDTKLINIGSCGLHILHNSFKAGVSAANWDVSSVLSSLYYIFKDSPARREDFVKVTGSELMPLKFVSHRWLENIPVCDRALRVWENVEVYVKAAQEKKVTRPENKSFAVLKEAVKDPLIKAKMCYFKCIAGHLQPFLENYQTDQPMVCFLSTDLSDIIRALMRRIVKDSELKAAATTEKLVKIDVMDKNIHVNYKDVDIGFSTDKALKDAVRKSEKGSKNVSERSVMQFRQECKAFVVAVLKKMLEKCPITYSLVRNMSALNPQEMQSNPTHCRKMFKQVLSVLVSSKRVKESDCDEILQQYSTFLDSIPVLGSDAFSTFNHITARVDEFFCKYMTDGKYGKLYGVVQLLLILSHGQAAVERGFSINKEVEVENLKKQSLVAQRIICDHVKTVGGVLNVDINGKLLQYGSMARQKYVQYLDDERQTKKSDDQQKTRKRQLDELDEIKERKKQIRLDIDALDESADKLSEQAESTGKLTFVTKANSYRRTSKEKKNKLKDLEVEIAAKHAALKQ